MTISPPLPRLSFILVALTSLSLTACQPLTTVKNVEAHPYRNWFTATVYLQGTVGDRVPLLKGQVYQLQDQTGKIWVLSSKRDLQSGDLIRIKGLVRYEAIEIAGQDRGEVYIEEQQQLKPKL